jgi:hypothetical protein
VKVHGATVHVVTPALDSGPIVIQGAVPVLADDTEATLAARVLAVEHRIYPQAVRWFAEGRLEFLANDVVRVKGSGVCFRLDDLPPGQSMTKRLLACLFFAATAAQAAPWRSSAEYRVTNLGVTIGSVNDSYQRSGERYSIRSTTRSEGAPQAHSRRHDHAGKPLAGEWRGAEAAGIPAAPGRELESATIRGRVRLGQRVPHLHLPRRDERGSAAEGDAGPHLGPLPVHERRPRALPRVAMHMSNGRKIELYTYASSTRCA